MRAADDDLGVDTLAARQLDAAHRAILDDDALDRRVRDDFAAVIADIGGERLAEHPGAADGPGEADGVIDRMRGEERAAADLVRAGARLRREPRQRRADIFTLEEFVQQRAVGSHDRLDERVRATEAELPGQ